MSFWNATWWAPNYWATLFWQDVSAVPVDEDGVVVLSRMYDASGAGVRSSITNQALGVNGA
jgi:hypothetical protein